MTIAERIRDRPRRERRALALALLAVATAAAWGALIDPLLGLFATQAEWRAAAVVEIDSGRALAAGEDELRASLATIEQSPLWGRFPRAEPSFDASLELDRTVQGVRAAADLTIRATERLPATPVGSLTRYGITVRTTARLGQLNAFLAGLRSTSSHLRVENLRVIAPTPGAGISPEYLDVSMDVVGYLRAVETSQGGA
jgi:MFS family permease